MNLQTTIAIQIIRRIYCDNDIFIFILLKLLFVYSQYLNSREFANIYSRISGDNLIISFSLVLHLKFDLSLFL